MFEPKVEGQTGGTHGLEGAVAGQPVGVQRLGTVLTRWDQLVQNVTAVRIVAAAQLLHAGDLHPETGHLLLQSHVHLKTRKQRLGHNLFFNQPMPAIRARHGLASRSFACDRV